MNNQNNNQNSQNAFSKGLRKKFVKTFANDVQLNKYFDKKAMYDYRILAFNDKGQILTIVMPLHLHLSQLEDLQNKALKKGDSKGVMKYTQLIKQAEDQDC